MTENVIKTYYGAIYPLSVFYVLARLYSDASVTDFGSEVAHRCCPHSSALALAAVFCRHELCPSSGDPEAWLIFVPTATVMAMEQNVLGEGRCICSAHRERFFLGQHDGLEETNEREVSKIITQNHEGGSFCVSQILCLVWF